MQDARGSCQFSMATTRTAATAAGGFGVLGSHFHERDYRLCVGAELVCVCAPPIIALAGSLVSRCMIVFVWKCCCTCVV